MSAGAQPLVPWSALPAAPTSSCGNSSTSGTGCAFNSKNARAHQRSPSTRRPLASASTTTTSRCFDPANPNGQNHTRAAGLSARHCRRRRPRRRTTPRATDVSRRRPEGGRASGPGRTEYAWSERRATTRSDPRGGDIYRGRACVRRLMSQNRAYLHRQISEALLHLLLTVPDLQRRVPVVIRRDQTCPLRELSWRSVRDA